MRSISTPSTRYYCNIDDGNGIINTIVNSTFSANRSEQDGGAIFLDDDSRIETIANNTFTLNVIDVQLANLLALANNGGRCLSLAVILLNVEE